MTSNQQRHIDSLTGQANGRDLVSLLTPSRTAQRRSELRAEDLRKLITVLNERLAKLQPDDCSGNVNG